MLFFACIYTFSPNSFARYGLRGMVLSQNLIDWISQSEVHGSEKVSYSSCDKESMKDQKKLF